MSGAKEIFAFLSLAEELKTTLRWTTLPDETKESSAEHSWAVALLVLLIAEDLKLDLDLGRALKIALVHDLPECVTGDFDSYSVEKGLVSKSEKNRQEKEAVGYLESLLPSGLGDHVSELWLEYDKAETREANLVKAVDKIESLFQIAKSGHKWFDDGLDHMGFYGNGQAERIPELKEFLREVKKELRREYEKAGHAWKEEYDRI